MSAFSLAAMRGALWRTDDERCLGGHATNLSRPMPALSTIQKPILRVLRPVLGGVELNHLARLLPVARMVCDARPSSVLDVGSGSRGLTRWLPAGIAVTPVDKSF